MLERCWLASVCDLRERDNGAGFSKALVKMPWTLGGGGREKERIMRDLLLEETARKNI